MSDSDDDYEYDSYDEGAGGGSSGDEDGGMKVSPMTNCAWLELVLRPFCVCLRKKTTAARRTARRLHPELQLQTTRR